MLKVGLIKRIGNGKSTNIWNENWLPRKFNMRSICSISNDPSETDDELICTTTKSWNLFILHQCLLPMDVDVVRQILISHVAQDDFWAWSYEKSGVFYVCSVYYLLSETKCKREGWLNGEAGALDVDQQGSNCRRLWKIKVPLKLQIFAWRLANSLMPTIEEKLRRHIVTWVISPICDASSDLWRHALL